MNKFDPSVADSHTVANINSPFHGLTYFCFAICIICIVAGTAVSLLAIWGGIFGPTLAKVFATIATFFFGSILTLVVTKRRCKRDELHNGGHGPNLCLGKASIPTKVRK